MMTTLDSPLRQSEHDIFSSISRAPWVNDSTGVLPFRILLFLITLLYVYHSFSTISVSDIYGEWKNLLFYFSLPLLLLHTFGLFMQTMLTSVGDVDKFYLIYLLFQVPCYSEIGQIQEWLSVKGAASFHDIYFWRVVIIQVFSIIFWGVWGISSRILFLKTFALAKTVLELDPKTLLTKYSLHWFGLIFLTIVTFIIYLPLTYNEIFEDGFGMMGMGIGYILYGFGMIFEIRLYHKINPFRHKQRKTWSELFYMGTYALLIICGLVFMTIALIGEYQEWDRDKNRKAVYFIDFVALFMDLLFYGRYAILWNFCVNELNVQKQLQAFGGEDARIEDVKKEIEKMIHRLDIVDFENIMQPSAPLK